MCFRFVGQTQPGKPEQKHKPRESKQDQETATRHPAHAENLHR